MQSAHDNNALEIVSFDDLYAKLLHYVSITDEHIALNPLGYININHSLSAASAAFSEYI